LLLVIFPFLSYLDTIFFLFENLCVDIVFEFFYHFISYTISTHKFSKRKYIVYKFESTVKVTRRNHSFIQSFTG
jgi:hypothetical protein